MNLRHIDPRSTDWMDAMLEGEPQTKGKRETQGNRDKVEEQPSVAFSGAQAAAPPHTLKPDTR